MYYTLRNTNTYCNNVYRSLKDNNAIDKNF